MEYKSSKFIGGGPILGTLASIGVGAGLAYLFDGNNGRRRRIQLRDQFMHGVRKSGRNLDVAVRDTMNRTRGIVAETKSAIKNEHPQRRNHRLDILQSHWAPATRLWVGIVGSALALAGLRQRGVFGGFASVTGGGLLARVITNREFRQIIGVDRSKDVVSVHKTITIAAPLDQVFAFWSDLKNFPHFMKDVREVRVSQDGKVSHWVVDGPAGMPISWDAETIAFIPDEVIAWRTVPGALIKNSGRLRFRADEGGRTRIDLNFSYSPPAGELGHFAAKIFGSDPKSKLSEGLSQIKMLLERGPSPRQAHGLH